MPRPTARRPTPIVLPNCPMDTLWEVDETADAEPRPSGSRPRQELRSVFEDDDDDVRNAFPLPPVSLPVRRFFSLPRMSLPIHSPPKRVPKYNTPPRPPRAASRPIIPFPRVPSPAAQRPVSPTSSASSSDTEPPRTPPAASSPLPAPKRKPAYVLAPPPPAEWESAIDALFDLDEEPPVRAKSRPRSSTPTPRRSPPREPESYISFSPVEDSGFPLSPSSDEFVLSPTSTDFCSAIGFASVWDSSYNRPLTSPGLTPTPVSPPARPRRVPERKSIPVQLIVS